MIRKAQHREPRGSLTAKGPAPVVITFVQRFVANNDARPSRLRPISSVSSTTLIPMAMSRHPWWFAESTDSRNRRAHPVVRVLQTLRPAATRASLHPMHTALRSGALNNARSQHTRRLPMQLSPRPRRQHAIRITGTNPRTSQERREPRPRRPIRQGRGHTTLYTKNKPFRDPPRPLGMKAKASGRLSRAYFHKYKPPTPTSRPSRQRFRCPAPS
ncbi:hypothetical protein QBC39DRAFT_182340 [Podospora conica]|nr:hypothetical protein QBC39DRAFT_182340 [Schizothecium conicum]